MSSCSNSDNLSLKMGDAKGLQCGVHVAPALMDDGLSTRTGRQADSSQKPMYAMKDHGKCYDGLFEGNRAVMLLIDPGSAKIVDANPSACAFYGYRIEDLIARRVSDIYLLSDDDLIREFDAVKRRHVSSRVARHRLAGGEVRDVEVHSSLVNVNGSDLLFDIVHDASDKLKDYENLRRYHKRLLCLFCEILLIEEQERRQLSNLLNDNIAQLIALTKIKLGEYSNGVRAADRKLALEHIRELIDETLREVRTLTFDISPPLLYDMGLPAAVEWLLEEIGKHHGLATALHIQGDFSDVEEVNKVLLFRSVREVVAGIAKRALARRLDVFVRRRGGYIEIALKDADGGIAAVQDDSHFITVQERLNHFGGYVLTEGGNDGGSRIRMGLPLKLRVDMLARDRNA